MKNSKPTKKAEATAKLKKQVTALRRRHRRAEAKLKELNVANVELQRQKLQLEQLYDLEVKAVRLLLARQTVADLERSQRVATRIETVKSSLTDEDLAAAKNLS